MKNSICCVYLLQKTFKTSLNIIEGRRSNPLFTKCRTNIVLSIPSDQGNRFTRIDDQINTVVGSFIVQLWSVRF